MKKIALTFLASSLLVASCGDKKEKSEEKTSENKEQTIKKDNPDDTLREVIAEKEVIQRHVELVPERAIPLESILSYVNEDELKQAFGGDNVSRGVGYMPEGMGTYMVTKIFVDTKNEVTVVWDDTTNASGISWIETRAKGGDWKTKQDLYVGMTASEAAAINEAPLTFSGLGWDFGGNVFGYNDGKLKNVRLEFGFDADDINLEKYGELLGDVELNTNMEIVKSAPLVVTKIHIE